MTEDSGMTPEEVTSIAPSLVSGVAECTELTSDVYTEIIKTVTLGTLTEALGKLLKGD